jgi:TonB family protein
MRKTTFVSAFYFCISLFCFAVLGMICLQALSQDTTPAAATAKETPAVAMPSNPINKSLSQTPPDAIPKVQKLRVSSGVMAGKAIKIVPPIYPEHAKRIGLAGTIVIHATINKEGHIADEHVISGSSELQQAALDAVKQWIFKPYLLNNEPIEIETDIKVTFNSAYETAQDDDSLKSPRNPVTFHIPFDMAQEHLQWSRQPEYPQNAKAAGISGTVVLEAVIGKNGHITELNAISGPSELQQAAMDAVRTWMYRPFLLKGEPQIVATTINVVFKPHR